MTRMIGDATFGADDGRNPCAGPELAAEAIGCGTARQQSRYAGEWRGSQPAGSPRRGAMAESVQATGTASRQPLADGALAHTEGFGDLTRRPALLCEVPGL
jgi:hypothetical protein